MQQNIISVKNLSKHFKVYKKEPGLLGSFKSLFVRKYETVKAVNDVSFNIAEGEIIGFIGQNGAGKTTTLKMLSGLLFPTTGEVSVLGFNPWDRKPEFQKQFALIMGQKNQLWWDISARDSYSLLAKIYGIRPDEAKKRIADLAHMFQCEDVLDTQLRRLSLGERKKG